MNICYIFTLTADIENLFGEFEDIRQLIFLPKFHDNSTLFGGVDSILGAWSQQKLKLN